MNRFIRNIGTINEQEQKKLKDCKVCIIGLGGLGGYIIEMITRLGVGYITVVDGDDFDVSNLNRQILANEENIGISKAYVAKERAEKINSEVSINTIDVFIDESNCIDIIKNHDIVIDCLDSIEKRLILQKYCNILGVVLIHGAINSWYGQVSTIYPGDNTLNYIYKNSIEIDTKSNPSFTPANIASIQVSEMLKVILNKGEVLRNKLLMVDLLYNEYNIIDIK